VEWLYLVLSFGGALLAVNALRPIYAPGPLAVASFFAGWLTAELALHALVLHVSIASAFAAVGAVTSWPGAVAIGFSALSTVLLVVAHRRSVRAREVMDRALASALGASFADELPPEARPWAEARLARTQIAIPALPTSGVASKRNIVFHTHGRLSLRLDVHRPDGTSAARPRRGQHQEGARRGCPTLVYVHGGAWMIGKRQFQGLPLMRHLARLGWVCFSVDYRLSPRATFPDHLVDVKRAIAWVRAHGEEYGADPSFLVIAGNSAGGHLAALAALTPNDPEYQPGFESADTKVQACVPFYGIYDFVDRHDHWPTHGMKVLLERYVMKAKRHLAREAFEKASPIARVRADAPPFLVVHGDTDTLATVNEARRFVAALRAASRAPVAYAEIPGAQHAFEVFPSVRTAHVVRGVARFCAWAYGATQRRDLKSLVLHPQHEAEEAKAQASGRDGDVLSVRGSGDQARAEGAR
jgi:acetyl esterase/lipase